ncbi:MAG: HTH domain-containing protein [Candidatus Dechloromonas phosphoritropha]|jgi:DeoR/GlpR family transcriptional regulator of sugar metabolism
MKSTQRIARINALLSRPQGATMTQLIEELAVSRATVNRDLDDMRNELNAPCQRRFKTDTVFHEAAI